MNKQGKKEVTACCRKHPASAIVFIFKSYFPVIYNDDIRAEKVAAFKEKLLKQE